MSSLQQIATCVGECDTLRYFHSEPGRDTHHQKYQNGSAKLPFRNEKKMKIHKRQTQKHLESHDLEIWPRGQFCRTQAVLPCLCPLDRFPDVWEFRTSVCRKWTLSSGEMVRRRSEATKKHCRMRVISSEICLPDSVCEEHAAGML